MYLVAAIRNLGSELKKRQYIHKMKVLVLISVVISLFGKIINFVYKENCE